MFSTALSIPCILIAITLFRPVTAVTDYLIVGGGTAGLTLANRLTEDPKVSVLVIEAGGDGLGNINISDITRIGTASGTDLDWQFPIEALKYANNRILTPVPRGKVLGGSSAINGDVYDRGDAKDYDKWEVLGNSGWNFNSLFSAAKKGEHFFAPNTTDGIQYILSDHGTSGPLATSYNGLAPEFHSIIIQGVVNAGGIESADQAGGNVTGISHVTSARLPSNSSRSDSATGYYFPYSYRTNLQVSLYSTVTKIIWKSIPRAASDEAIASGVEYIDANGKIQTANATTVILAAGVLSSPPILERSGIGNAKLLSSLGIEIVVDLPGVGENLNEQPMIEMQWQLNSSLPLPGSPFLLNFESLQTTFGDGNLDILESLLNTQPEGLSGALWDLHRSLYEEEAPWVEGYITLASPTNGPSTLGWSPVNLHPLSRGYVHIKSSDGLEYPEIQYNFFQNPVDLYILAASAKRVQEIVSTPPLSDFITAPIAPGAGIDSIDDLSEYVKAKVTYAYHVQGTTLLAPREIGGVVDSKLKVYGTRNVYVVDDSIIPVQPAAHTQATVYALAEHAAQLFNQ